MPSPGSPRGGKVVLDTGPLLTYLALDYLEKTAADKARRNAVLRDVRGSSDYRSTEIEQGCFDVLVCPHKCLLTTSLVVAEVRKLRGHSLLSRDEYHFRELALAKLEQDVDDIPYSLRDLCAAPDFRDLVCRLGLTDASLICLAAKERCLLLTDDRRMFQGLYAGAKFDMRLLGEYLKSPE
jgi:predicted nucleic acid-binding protein